MPRVILSPVNNRTSGFAASQILSFELAGGPFAIDPAFPASLSFYFTSTSQQLQTAAGPPPVYGTFPSSTANWSPAVGLAGLVEQITVSSRASGAQLSLTRYFPQTCAVANMAMGPYELQTLGHLTKQAPDYYSQRAVLGNYGVLLAANRVHVAFPLSAIDLFATPDLAGKSLSDFGGLRIDLKLSANANVFADTASTGAFTVFDVNLHIATLLVGMDRDMARPVFMRTTDSRSDVILNGQETRSVSLNSAAGEAIILTALPQATANSYAGDSVVALRLAATASDYSELVTAQADAVTSFFESVNGIQRPIGNVLTTRSPNGKQAEVMFLELLKAMTSESRPRRLKSAMNLYSYEFNVISAGSSTNKSYLPVNGPTSMGPLVVIPQTQPLADGVNPLPSFALGYLMRKGGAPLLSSSSTYTITSSISVGFISYVFVRSIRRLETSQDKKTGAIALLATD